ncbi:unnamed protein product [Adineta ricciae]|uniref:Arrestin C-terminal-like domain-containing protein n=1 Tax=Adineta ricciae TaxID=249248 RepID=A0A815A1W9_ADIRI|nr:unnamed protein product [Adineta ricciae]CAF1251287.1 unnamed protein product [Adineta ricciae]
MGSGVTTLQDNVTFQFDKKYSTIYKTSETVSGKVKFQNDGQIELKLKNIMIEIAGEIVYYTLRGPNLAKSSDIHVRPFFNEQHILRSGDAQSSFLLEQGEHIWPFSFCLPDNLPSTLAQSRIKGPSIRYVVRVHFVPSDWLKRRIQKASFILVQYHSSPMLSNEIRNESQNSKNIDLQATLHEDFVTPGEKCPLTVNINNPNRVTITRLSMTLIQYQNLGAAGEDEVTVIKKDLNGIDNFQGDKWQNEFQIQIPERIVSSYTGIPSQWSSRKPLVIRYELCLEAHCTGLFTNVCVRLPFAVGHQKQKKVDEDPFPPKYDKLFLV